MRQAEYQVISFQELMSGADDLEIIKLAFNRGGYIITEDKDFGDELVFREGDYYGALLLRLSGVAIETKIRLLISAIENYPEELLNSFAVLNKKKLRIRKRN